MTSRPPGSGTRAARGGERRKNALDAVTQPIVCTSTYAFDGTAEIRDHFEGRIQREEYGRYGNPTVRTAERKIAELDGAEDCVLFSSGMAAATTALLALLKSGQHVVMTSDCYRRTRQFVSTTLPRWGIDHTFVEPGDYEALEGAIRPGKTRLVLAESPTNPYLRVVDLPRLVAIRDRHPGVKILIDSTFATPVNERPVEFGVDLVLHSATKYLGGHNDLLAGSLSGKASLISGLRDLRGVLGAVLDPHAAYLLLRGAKTLELRVRRQNETALRVAAWLEAHPRVERVFYPGLAEPPGSRRRGAPDVGLRRRRELPRERRPRRRVPLHRRHDACPSSRRLSAGWRASSSSRLSCPSTSSRRRSGSRSASHDNLVRLAVGIEDADDLVADLGNAFAVSA